MTSEVSTSRVLIVSRPPAGIASRAFSIRFMKTCCSFDALP